MRRGGTTSDHDGVAVRDMLRRSRSDSRLFFLHHRGSIKDGRLRETLGLAWLARDGSAMRPLNESLTAQLQQVAPHSCLTDSESLTELSYGRSMVCLHEGNYLLAPFCVENSCPDRFVH
jgi:hypothetical protein